MCFAGPGWSKISNLSKIFNATQISWFCQFSGFLQDQGGQKSQIWAKFPTWLKFLKFAKLYVSQDWADTKSQILAKNDSNFLILPNIMLCRTGAVKNLKFEQNFQCDSNRELKFLDFRQFHGLQDYVGQKSKI